MNYSMIFYIIGWILDVEAALLVPSLAVSLIYHESCALAFFITIVLCLIPGVILVRKQPKNKVFYAREGSVTVALSWIVMSIMGSIPFLLSGSITNPVDALFETVSGCVWIYDDRCQYSSRRGTASARHPVLEELYTLDRWYGSSRVPSLPASAYRKRLSYEPHEGREPGPLCHKAGPEGAVHRKDPLWALSLRFWSLFSCLWDGCRCLIPCVPFSVPREPEASASRTTASEAIPPTFRA